MREHPAARQSETINRIARTSFDSIDIMDHPEADVVPSLVKETGNDNDGKLGELPEFLVYVYKARKYDLF